MFGGYRVDRCTIQRLLLAADCIRRFKTSCNLLIFVVARDGIGWHYTGLALPVSGFALNPGVDSKAVDATIFFRRAIGSTFVCSAVLTLPAQCSSEKKSVAGMVCRINPG